MIVSHKYRFIFLRTEKTGGTSLANALQAILGEEDFTADLKRPSWAKYSPIHHGALCRNFPSLFGFHPHATARQARDVLGRKTFNGYFKFAVERNPWDRQVSLYVHRQWKRGEDGSNFDRDMRSRFYRNTEYVRLNNWSIYAIGNDIVADKILRYETLAQDLQLLAAELNFGQELNMPQLRKYDGKRPHYSSYYSNKTRELVARWYEKEITAFDYRFETTVETAQSPLPLSQASPLSGE